MRIRRMFLGDYETVKRLWLECELSNEPEDSREEIQAFLETPQAAGFVAIDGEAVLGAALCGSDGRYGYIYHLAVASAARQQGLGRALVQACDEFLQKRHIIIMVREDNLPGREFWQRLDFKPADTLRIQFRQSGFFS